MFAGVAVQKKGLAAAIDAEADLSSSTGARDRNSPAQLSSAQQFIGLLGQQMAPSVVPDQILKET